MGLKQTASICALLLGLGSCGTGTYLWNAGQRHIGQGMMSTYARAELLASDIERENLDNYLNPEFTTRQKVGYGLHFCGYVFLLSSLGLRRKEEALNIPPTWDESEDL
jgi:hypothetical protein